MNRLINLPDRSNDANERLLDLETRFHLLEYKIDGWCAWPLLRFRLASLLADLPIDPPNSLLPIQKIGITIRNMPDYLNLTPVDLVIKTYTSAFGEKDGELYKDIYFDDLLLGRHYLKIEAINNPLMINRSKKARYPAKIYSTLVDTWSFFAAKFSPPNHNIVAASLGIYNALRQEKISVDLPLMTIQNRFSRFHYAWLFYRKCLQQVKPGILLVADPSEFEIVAAARSLNIKTVELSHGFLNRNHWSYSWLSESRFYIHSMPLPDHLFLYGDYFKDELDTRGFWGDRLRVVGSPRIDSHRGKPRQKPDDHCHIVFTTQGIDRENVITFINRFMELAQVEAIPVRLTIKLHPAYDTDAFLYQKGLENQSNVQVLGAAQSPGTFDLIRNSHFHISISSTCHYEALALGTPTVVLPFETRVLVMDLVEKGHAAFVTSPEDLVAIIREWKNVSVPKEVGAYYFKPGAVANMLSELGLSLLQ